MNVGLGISYFMSACTYYKQLDTDTDMDMDIFIALIKLKVKSLGALQ